MLSLKRLLAILMVTLLLGVVYFSYTLNESRVRQVELKNNIPAEEVFLKNESWDVTEQIKYLLVGEKSTVRDNAETLLATQKLPYKVREKLEQKDLKKGNILIFCTDTLEDCVDVKLLEAYLTRGGKMILASGIAEGYADSYLLPVLGIVEKSTRENYNTFSVSHGFLPFSEKKMTYSGYCMSTWISLREDADIYMADIESQVPIVYSYPHGMGKSVVINASFLEDMSCMGILSGAIGIATEEYIYPVMGTECVFLDHFPIVTYINDGVSTKLYGRTTESFVRDELWPVFQRIAMQNQIRYTSSVLVAAPEGIYFPETNRGLLYTMGKSAMQFEGEVILAADLPESTTYDYNTAFFQGFRETFTNYRINALAITSGRPDPEVLKSLKEEVGDIRVLRSSIQGGNKEFVAGFSIEEGYYTCPVLSDQISLDDGNIFAISSGLAAYGAVSQQFDVDEFIATSQETSNWDEYSEELGDYDTRVFEKTGWLDRYTISEMENRIRSYSGLSYGWYQEGSDVVLKSTNCQGGQPFFFRTDRTIISAQGAEYQKISEGYYMIRIREPEVRIQLTK